MLEFIYVLKPSRLEMLTDGATPQESETVSRHFQYLQGLTEKGTAVLVGRTQTVESDTFGIVVFRAASEDEARSCMENDPAVANGVMLAQLYPFRIALSALGAPSSDQA